MTLLVMTRPALLTAASDVLLLPGFQHYYGGVNQSASTLVAVTHWDTEENANFSREVIADAVTALMGQGVTLEAATVDEVLAEV